jgi:FdhD protein
MADSMLTVSCTEFKGNQVIQRADVLAVEQPLEIALVTNVGQLRTKKTVSVTMRTPGQDEALAIGFLITEGIISHNDDIASVNISSDLAEVELHPHVQVDLQRAERNFYTTSSCGVCGKTSIEAVMYVAKKVISKIKIEAEFVKSMPELLRKAQPVFEKTGGLHASGLFTPDGEIKIVSEDVGRHNALDKLIGNALRSGLILENYVVALSGRISFELVQKAVVAGIPILVAVGAPSSLAVQLATQAEVTLCGFAGIDRFNIYTHPERIIF